MWNAKVTGENKFGIIPRNVIFYLTVLSCGLPFPFHCHINGNGYLITQAEKVNVSRQHQTSAENKNRQPTQGNFSSAWIDHGIQPKDHSYEYMVFLDATSG